MGLVVLISRFVVQGCVDDAAGGSLLLVTKPGMVLPHWTVGSVTLNLIHEPINLKRSKPMPGLFGAYPPLMLIAIAIAMLAIVVFALMTAGY